MAISLSKCSSPTLNSTLKTKADYKPVLTHDSRYNLNKKVHLREMQNYFLTEQQSYRKTKKFALLKIPKCTLKSQFLFHFHPQSNSEQQTSIPTD